MHAFEVWPPEQIAMRGIEDMHAKDIMDAGCYIDAKWTPYGRDGRHMDATLTMQAIDRKLFHGFGAVGAPCKPEIC